jgi:DNA polymerase elongation subunit (family B)
MTNHFYTSAHCRGDTIYVRGYSNGKPFKETVEYQPYLFARDPVGEFRTLDGESVSKIHFDSIKDAKNFVKEYEQSLALKISNAPDPEPFFGLTNFLYTYLNDEFYGEIKYDPTQIARVSVDIETMSDSGFPDPKIADKEITAVTLSHRQNGQTKRLMFGTKAYRPKLPGVAFCLCENERELIIKLLECWNDPEWTPDILTGWFVEGFDIPYLLNRTKNVLGDSYIKMWSPWRIVQDRDIVRGKSQARGGTNIANRIDHVYELYGITVLDYMELYKKFSFKNHESYKLDHIAFVELGERKLDYSEYGSLHNFYEKNYEGYMDYNLDDTIKIDKLDDKLKLIDLVLAMAYSAKITYQDTMTTTRPWDVLIHNFLLEQKIVVPQQGSVINRQIMGGYVKDTVPGMYKWVVSFDLNSLYPHIIMQYNISPEMVEKVISGWDCTKIVNGIPVMDLDMFLLKCSEYNNELARKDVTTSGIGVFFKKDGVGFIPTIMKKFYDGRVVYKKMMLEAQRRFEETKSPEDEKEIARCYNMQMAMKLFLNSGYGALANQFFRWFDPDLAESVTSSGQITTMWIERKINELMNKLLKTTDLDYVIAADTDSIYINFEPLVKAVGLENAPHEKVIDFLDVSCKSKFEPYIEKSFEELQKIVNAPFQKMKMKREIIADKAVFSAKKMYILNVWDSEGVRYKEPKLKMKGVQAVRSSTPMVVRDKIKNIYSIIMNKDEGELQDFVEKFREEFHTLPFTDIAFPRGCNNMAKFEDAASIYRTGTPIQVKGSLIYNHLIKEMGLENKYELIKEGSKIKFAYLKTPNHIHQSVIAVNDVLPPEFGLDDYIDYETQFIKTFQDPISKITDIVGWKTEAGSGTLLDLL